MRSSSAIPRLYFGGKQGIISREQIRYIPPRVEVGFPEGNKSPLRRSCKYRYCISLYNLLILLGLGRWIFPFIFHRWGMSSFILLSSFVQVMRFITWKKMSPGKKYICHLRKTERVTPWRKLCYLPLKFKIAGMHLRDDKFLTFLAWNHDLDILVTKIQFTASFCTWQLSETRDSFWDWNLINLFVSLQKINRLNPIPENILYFHMQYVSKN